MNDISARVRNPVTVAALYRFTRFEDCAGIRAALTTFAANTAFAARF